MPGYSYIWIFLFFFTLLYIFLSLNFFSQTHHDILLFTLTPFIFILLLILFISDRVSIYTVLNFINELRRKVVS